MAKATQLGTNRTGIRTSPFDASALLEVSDTSVSHENQAASPYLNAKIEYSMQAEPLGSVPPPTTVRGALQSGKEALTGKRPQVILDKIAERLAFERSGCRLYEGIIVKHQADPENAKPVPLAELQKHLTEEMQHFRLLVEAMEQLGGDPTAQTPRADVVGIEGMGLMQLVNEPRTKFPQALEAILAAELIDVDGWTMLIKVAADSGHKDLAAKFQAAHETEEKHLAEVRRWMMALTQAELKRTA